MYGVDAAILMNQKVWQASGHTSGFNDPMVECLNCHSRLRQDHIIDSKCSVCGNADNFSEPRQFNMMFDISKSNSLLVAELRSMQSMIARLGNNRLILLDLNKCQF
jgi:glycyl-tRNA synthetase (class II)